MKKVVSFCIALVLGMLLYSPSVYAADVNKKVDITNSQIDKKIANAVSKADNTGEDDSAIINSLIKATDSKAAALEKWAEKKGVVVESEYVPVDIGGTEILVDPCRVIGM